MDIQFFAEQCDMPISQSKEDLVEKWIEDSIKNEKCEGDFLNIIFCSNDYLLQINKKYLKHDYFTDIITFEDNDETAEGVRIIAGELFISLDMVRDNATRYKVPYEVELFRVVIHGVLHLIGYDDLNDEQQTEMSSKEDFYLERFK